MDRPGFRCGDYDIRVVDFEGTVYAIALDNGAIRIVGKDKPYPHE